jgi:hypothetical protein
VKVNNDELVLSDQFLEGSERLRCFERHFLKNKDLENLKKKRREIYRAKSSIYSLSEAPLQRNQSLNE